MFTKVTTTCGHFSDEVDNNDNISLPQPIDIEDNNDDDTDTKENEQDRNIHTEKEVIATRDPSSYVINKLRGSRGRGRGRRRSRGRGRGKYIASSPPNSILSQIDNNNDKIDKADCQQNKNEDEKEQIKPAEFSENKMQRETVVSIDKNVLQSITLRIDAMNKQIQSLTDCVQHIEERVTNIEQKEQKEDIQTNNEAVPVQIMCEFNKMQQQIDKLVKLQLGGNNDKKEEDTEEDKVRGWMKNIVKLPQYSDMLIDNGYDDMECIVDITMHDLQEMGVEKIGHRRKIMKNAQKLGNIHDKSKKINMIINNNDNVNSMNEIYYKRKEIVAAPAIYSFGLPWICGNCNTHNGASCSLCKLCGVNRSFAVKSQVEGPNVYDTAH